MVELPQRTWGEPSGRRALLVHGLSSDSGSWWRVAGHLATRGWHVTAVDLRGHGTAPRADSYTLAEYAGDLPAGPWDLVVGHSLGGASAVVAAHRAEFAKRLVLIDPVLAIPDALRSDIAADQVSELEYTAETIAADRPHWHERDREAKLSGVRTVDPSAVTRSFDDNPGWDLTSEAEALGVPTLILSGDPEVYTMLDPTLARGLPVDYVVIVGAGHSPHRDRPDETLAALDDWLHATDPR